MTRDEAIRLGVRSLATWHRQEHGDGCPCVEGDQFGRQSAAVIDGLIADVGGFTVTIETTHPAHPDKS